MKRFFIAVFSSIVFAVALNAAEPLRPNIVIFLADDMGYADAGFSGGKQIKTPNIDKLAASGARLSDYYVQPVCSPTRGALLTGRYPMRLGLQVGVIWPWEKRGLPLTERTLAQALKECGYETAICGKWHLGLFQPDYLPTHRGFDHQYGHYCGAIDYFDHTREGGFDWHRDDKVCRDEGYSTHLDAKEAIRLINSYTPGKPFFLYVPFNAVHVPHQVPESYKEPYASLPEPRRTYAGMMAAMDEAIGNVYAALDKRGFLTNTLILFSSDNGGPSPGKVTDNGPFRGGKGSLYEGGVRVCACVSFPGQIKPGSTISTPLHAVDWFPTFLALAGAQPPQGLTLDGQNIWKVLTEGQTIPGRTLLLNSTPTVGGVRVGDWKLIVRKPGFEGEDAGADYEKTSTAKRKKGKKANVPEPQQLFNLATDAYEKTNLAASEPKKLQELLKIYQGFAAQAAPVANKPRSADFKAPKIWGEQDPESSFSKP